MTLFSLVKKHKNSCKVAKIHYKERKIVTKNNGQKIFEFCSTYCPFLTSISLIMNIATPKHSKKNQNEKKIFSLKITAKKYLNFLTPI